MCHINYFQKILEKPCARIYEYLYIVYSLLGIIFINLVSQGYIMSTFTKFITITSTALLMAAPLYASKHSSPDSGFEQQQQTFNRVNVNNQDDIQLNPPIVQNNAPYNMYAQPFNFMDAQPFNPIQEPIQEINPHFSELINQNNQLWQNLYQANQQLHKERQNTGNKLKDILSTKTLNEKNQKIYEYLFSCTDQAFTHLDVRYLCIKQAAMYQILDEKSTVNISNLALVCKEWAKFIQDELAVGKDCWKALHGIKTPEDEAISQIFQKARLVYKPNKNNDEGKIEWLFSNLEKLHNGVFDFSKCGEIYKYLRITTSLSTFFAPEEGINARLNILIATKYLINKFRSTTAKPFAGIKDRRWHKDTAPVGIFWRMSDGGTEHGYAYLTTESIEWISGTSLHTAREASLHVGTEAGLWSLLDEAGGGISHRFHVCFVNQNKD